MTTTVREANQGLGIAQLEVSFTSGADVAGVVTVSATMYDREGWTEADVDLVLGELRREMLRRLAVQAEESPGELRAPLHGHSLGLQLVAEAKRRGAEICIVDHPGSARQPAVLRISGRLAVTSMPEGWTEVRVLDARSRVVGSGAPGEPMFWGEEEKHEPA
jgi:hypothetical protein